MNNADAQLATCYGPVSQAFVDRAAKIRLLILDVDGVLSDGLIYMGNHGEELKAFNVRDVRRWASRICTRGSRTSCWRSAI